MSLCSKCALIHFSTLPWRPKGEFYNPPERRIKRHAKHIGVKYTRISVDVPGGTLFDLKSSGSSLGRKHWRYQALISHALTCQLCARFADACGTFHNAMVENEAWNDLYGPASVDTDNFVIYLSQRITLRMHNDGIVREGCSIWTKSRKSKYAFFIGSVGLCVNAGDPLASRFDGRPIEPDPTNTSFSNIITRWVSDCDSYHSDVTLTPKPKLPDRVIDLTVPPPYKLINTTSQYDHYTTLSYCWPPPEKGIPANLALKGQRDKLKALMNNNLSYYLTALPSPLPRVYKDAITVTKLLGIKYLWVDALCIRQNNEPEKNNQIPQMADIYSNSYVTIAVAWHNDPEVGCLGFRDPPTYAEFQYTLLDGTTIGKLQAFLEPYDLSFATQTPDQPLRNEIISTRGWTFQERILSPRTLHFTENQVFFECRTHFVGEDGYNYDQESHLDIPTTTKEARTYWNEMIELYSSRTLGQKSDKLRAIAGLANAVNNVLGDTYVAGLWKGTGARDFLWVRASKPTQHWPPNPYRAPSWSWAAIDGEVFMPEEPWRTAHRLTKTKGFSVTQNNTYGEVTNTGKVKVRGPRLLIRATRGGSDGEFHFRTAHTGRRLKHIARLDYKFTVRRLRKKRIYAVPITRGPRASGSTGHLYSCIIVVREAGKYHRIGAMTVDGDNLGSEEWGRNPSDKWTFKIF